MDEKGTISVRAGWNIGSLLGCSTSYFWMKYVKWMLKSEKYTQYTSEEPYMVSFYLPVLKNFICNKESYVCWLSIKQGYDLKSWIILTCTPFHKNVFHLVASISQGPQSHNLFHNLKQPNNY